MHIKQGFLLLLAVTVIGVGAARAASITVSLDNPDQFGAPGSTLEYLGTITNTGSDTAFLNSDDFSLAGTSGDFTFDDSPYFSNAPLFLNAGGSSGDIELFDIVVSAPFPDSPGYYPGSFTVVGGSDGGAQDVLGAVNFSVSVTPEPGSAVLLFAGAAAAIAALRRRRI